MDCRCNYLYFEFFSIILYMKLLSKKGLLQQKPLSISYIYKNKQKDNDYTSIIVKFSQETIIRYLLFKFVNNLPFAINKNIFSKQLKLLEPLTLDEQIKIINTTIEKGWKSLEFEYSNMMKRRNNNENK